MPTETSSRLRNWLRFGSFWEALYDLLNAHLLALGYTGPKSAEAGEH